MQNAIKNYIFYPLAFIDLVIKWEKYSINSSLTKEQIVEKPLEYISSIILREKISVRHSAEVPLVTV